VPPGGELTEICGNCIDDDGNGLTDFEDPACCPAARSFAMLVRKLLLKPHGARTRLRLKTTLAEAGLADVDPLTEDVFLQIRRTGMPDALCAKVPAAHFMHMHRAFKFWDKRHRVASAKGIEDMTIVVRRDGSVRLRTQGRRVRMDTPGPGQLEITVGFQNPALGDAQNRCSAATIAR
jgi:hypothetical protein